MLGQHSLWVQGNTSLVDKERKAEWGGREWLGFEKEIPECGSQEYYLVTW